MQRKSCRRIFAVILIMLLFSCMFSNVKSEAKNSKTLKTPTIKVKVSGNCVKITIKKTKGAGSYIIDGHYNGLDDFYEGTGVELSYWENELILDDDYYYPYRIPVRHEHGSFQITLNKDGTKKRTVSLELPAGEVTVKVCAVNDSETSYSKYCKEKTVNIKDPTGYKTSYDFSNVKKGDII